VNFYSQCTSYSYIHWTKVQNCSSAHPHLTVKFYTVDRILHDIKASTTRDLISLDETDSDNDNNDAVGSDWLSKLQMTEDSSTMLEFNETEIDLSSSTLTDALEDAPLISDVPRATADVAMAAKEEEGGSFVLGKWLA
jgi:hypothetical protein